MIQESHPYAPNVIHDDGQHSNDNGHDYAWMLFYFVTIIVVLSIIVYFVRRLSVRFLYHRLDNGGLSLDAQATDPVMDPIVAGVVAPSLRLHLGGSSVCVIFEMSDGPRNTGISSLRNTSSQTRCETSDASTQTEHSQSPQP